MKPTPPGMRLNPKEIGRLPTRSSVPWKCLLDATSPSPDVPGAMRARKVRPELLQFAGPIRPKSRTDAETSQKLATFGNVLLDARDDRGGNGDVAAGYLTARDLVERLKYNKPIILLVKPQGLRILRRLTGEDVQPGMPILGGSVVVHTDETAPRQGPPVGLYMAMASPSGYFRFEKDFATNGQPGIVRIDDQSVRLTSTVFGRTEAETGTPYFSQVRVAKERFELRAPGFGLGASGIYPDREATLLKAMSPEERLEYALELLEAHENDGTREALTQLLRGEVLQGKGTQFTVAYGFGHNLPATELFKIEKQFREYVEGLQTTANKKQCPVVVVTPSSVSKAIGVFGGTVEYFKASEGAQLPKDAKPGHVYIIEVDTNRAYKALLSLINQPAVASGDASTSAALHLGIPFTSTEVSWNKTNRKHLFELLKQSAPSELWPQLEAGLSPERRDWMKNADVLSRPELQPVFQQAGDRLPVLTDRLVESAFAARKFSSQAPTWGDILDVRDASLRFSMLLRSVQGGDPVSTRVFLRMLEQKSERLVPYLSRDLVRLPRVREALEKRHLRRILDKGFPLSVQDRPWLAAIAVAGNEEAAKFFAAAVSRGTRQPRSGRGGAFGGYRDAEALGSFLVTSPLGLLSDPTLTPKLIANLESHVDVGIAIEMSQRRLPERLPLIERMLEGWFDGQFKAVAARALAMQGIDTPEVRTVLIQGFASSDFWAPLQVLANQSPSLYADILRGPLEYLDPSRASRAGIEAVKLLAGIDPTSDESLESAREASKEGGDRLESLAAILLLMAVESRNGCEFLRRVTHDTQCTALRERLVQKLRDALPALPDREPLRSNVSELFSELTGHDNQPETLDWQFSK